MEPVTKILLNIAVSGASAAARKILQLEDQRTRELKHIKALVEANLGGEYNAALQDLKIVANANTTPQSVARHLTLAEERLGVAFGKFEDVDPLQAAWAAVHLTTICIATDRNNEAVHWAREAHGCAVRAEDLVSQQLKDQADGRLGRLRLTSEDAEKRVIATSAAVTGTVAATAITIGTGGAALIPIGVGLAAAGAVRMYRKHKLNVGSVKVAELSAFVNALMDLRRQLGDRDISKSS